MPKSIEKELSYNTVKNTEMNLRPIQEYRNGQPFLFPFHFLLIPITIMYRLEIEKQHLMKRETRGNVAGQTDRDKLFCTLCDRYSSSLASETPMMDNYIGRRDSNFAEAIALQRHNSIMRQSRRPTKRRETVAETNFSL